MSYRRKASPRPAPIEFIIQTQPRGVDGCRRIDPLRGEREREGLRAQVQMQIFEPGDPIGGYPPLDAAARDPSRADTRCRFHRAGGREIDRADLLGARELFMCPGKAAGTVKQNIVPRIAEPPAYRTESVDLIVALAKGGGAISGTLQIRGRNVGFQPYDPIAAQCVVKSELAAAGQTAALGRPRG